MPRISRRLRRQCSLSLAAESAEGDHHICMSDVPLLLRERSAIFRQHLHPLEQRCMLLQYCRGGTSYSEVYENKRCANKVVHIATYGIKMCSWHTYVPSVPTLHRSTVCGAPRVPQVLWLRVPRSVFASLEVRFPCPLPLFLSDVI